MNIRIKDNSIKDEMISLFKIHKRISFIPGQVLSALRIQLPGINSKTADLYISPVLYQVKSLKQNPVIPTMNVKRLRIKATTAIPLESLPKIFFIGI